MDQESGIENNKKTTFTPIAALEPFKPLGATDIIRAIISILWPYSSSTSSCALLIAEPDFRLRSHKGQIRIQLHGAAANALARCHVTIGDTVELQLSGARWVQESAHVKTPGRSVEGELVFRKSLRARIYRNENLLSALDVHESPSPVASPSLSTPPPQAASTPLRTPFAPPTSLVHASPFRLNLDAHRSPADYNEDDHSLEERPRKRIRTSGLWRYERVSEEAQSEAEVGSPPNILSTPGYTASQLGPDTTDTQNEFDSTHQADSLLGVPLLQSKKGRTRMRSLDQQSALRTIVTSGLTTHSPTQVQLHIPTSPRIRPIQSAVLPQVSPLSALTSQHLMDSTSPTPLRSTNDPRLADPATGLLVPHLTPGFGPSHHVYPPTTFDGASSSPLVRPLNRYEHSSVVSQPAFYFSPSASQSTSPRSDHGRGTSVPRDTSDMCEVILPDYDHVQSSLEDDSKAMSSSRHDDMELVSQSPPAMPSEFDMDDGAHDVPTSPAFSIPSEASSEVESEIQLTTVEHSELRQSSPGPDALDPHFEVGFGRLHDASSMRNLHRPRNESVGIFDEVRTGTSAPELSAVLYSDHEDASDVSPTVHGHAVKTLQKGPTVIELDSSSDEGMAEQGTAFNTEMAPVVNDNLARTIGFQTVEVDSTTPYHVHQQDPMLLSGKDIVDSISNNWSQTPMHDEEPPQAQGISVASSFLHVGSDHRVGSPMLSSAHSEPDNDAGVTLSAHSVLELADKYSQQSNVLLSVAETKPEQPRQPTLSNMSRTELGQDIALAPTPESDVTDLEHTGPDAVLDTVPSEQQSQVKTSTSQYEHDISPISPMIPHAVSGTLAKQLNMEGSALTATSPVTHIPRHEVSIERVHPDQNTSPLPSDDATDKNETGDHSWQDHETNHAAILKLADAITVQDIHAGNSTIQTDGPENAQNLESLQQLTPQASQSMSTNLIDQSVLGHRVDQTLDKHLLLPTPQVSEITQDMIESSDHRLRNLHAVVLLQEEAVRAEEGVITETSSPKSEAPRSLNTQVDDSSKQVTTSRTRISEVPEAISKWFTSSRSSVASAPPTTTIVDDYDTLKQGSARKSAPSVGFSFGTSSYRMDSTRLGDGKEADHKEAAQPTVTGKSPRRNHRSFQGLRTSLSYYSPLGVLEKRVNSSSGKIDSLVDVMAVITSPTSKPERAKDGPKDYHTTCHISDSSSANDKVQVQVFRPFKYTLPVAKVGDVILLRHFAVKSRAHRFFLLSGDSSAWYVWRFSQRADTDGDANVEQDSVPFDGTAPVVQECHGPPLDLGEEEQAHARVLRKWWMTLRSAGTNGEGPSDAVPSDAIPSQSKL